MADKQINIRIETDADTSGATQATKSLDQLEKEVRDLQRQLKAAPIGGTQFQKLAGDIKVAQTEMIKAESEANRLGATIGRRNLGGAILETSRAIEDAQYGIRGVLNNIPGLIAMLGGSAGLAGVISIAAVASTQLFEYLGRKKTSQDAIKNIDQVKDVLKTLGEALRQIGESENERNSLNLAERYEQLKRGIDSQTNSQLKGIEALQDRIKHERELAGIQKESTLNSITNQETLGIITPKQAQASREKVESSSAKFDLEQQKKLDDANKEAQVTKLKAAQDEKKAAEEAKKEAELRLKERRDAIKAAEAMLKLRQQLDYQVAEQEKKIGEERKKLYKTETTGGVMNSQFLSQTSKVKDLDVEKRVQSLEEELNQLKVDRDRRAPISAQGREIGDTTYDSPAKRAVDRLIQGDDRPMSRSEPLSKLEGEVDKFGSVAEEAARKVAQANADLERAAEEMERNERQREEVAIEQAKKKELENMGSSTIESSNRAMADLSALASQFEKSPDLAPVVQQINNALSDKVLTTEELRNISTSLMQNQRQIGDLGANILGTARDLNDRLSSLSREFTKLKSQQGKINY